jgi:hypothetical protein
MVDLDNHWYRKWRTALWPLGGTMLGLIVVPIAIEQYPEIFKESRWILPVSVLFVAACWIAPLLFHERAERCWNWSRKKFGMTVTLIVISIFVASSLYGSRWLYHLHVRHLAVRLAQSQQPQMTTTPLPVPIASTAPLPPKIDQTATDSDCSNFVAESDAKISCEAEKEKHNDKDTAKH